MGSNQQVSEQPATPAPSCAFTFVTQKGELEGLSLLLAASLKRSLQGSYELIAAIPTPTTKWGEVDPITLSTFEQMGVRVEYFQNPISGHKKGDFLTNKIYCFDLKTEMNKLVFLDSDLLCLRPLNYEQSFQAPFNATATFLATGGNWEAVYAAVGRTVPLERVLTSFSNELQPPYFNSGLVAVDAQLAPMLKQQWLECFHAIDHSEALNHKPYFREQVSLAVALMCLGWRYQVLDRKHNYWVKFNPIDPDDPPYFLHHTWPHPPIYHQPFLKSLIHSLISEYPAIAPLVRRCRWKYYLRARGLVWVNHYAHSHRKSIQPLLGKQLTNFMIHGHV